MYGLDDIPGWLRLRALMPQDYRVLVDDQKSFTDLWMNLRFLATLIGIETVVLAVLDTSAAALAFLVLLMMFLAERFCEFASRAAAIQWGEVVKASYDVFLPKLSEALQLPDLADPGEERARWIDFSRAVIYRNPEALPQRQVKEVVPSSKRGPVLPEGPQEAE
jgi:hypothetical protein